MIQADRIPRETLDEHVTVGGEYFDVLRGDYRLEPLGNGVTRVTSRASIASPSTTTGVRCGRMRHGRLARQYFVRHQAEMRAESVE